jgi:hypothetical protein
VVIDRVLNGAPGDPQPVFRFNESAPTVPTYVTARVTVPSRGERDDVAQSAETTLDDGFFLRNLSVN